MKFIVTFLSITISLHCHAQSVLSSGQWHKVKIEETGLYKLDRDFLINELDIPTSVNPATIKVFGVRGGMLPQSNSISRVSDPNELAIWSSGDEDGSMDTGDFFLFFAEGPDGFSFDSLNNPQHEKNLYADETYYFVTYGGGDGKRITTQTIDPTLKPTVTTYTDYLTYEVDEYSVLRSGRNWLGEAFRRTQDSQQTFDFDVSGATGQAKVWAYLAANTELECSFDISINGSVLGQVVLEPIENILYADKVKYNSGSFEHTFTGSSIELKLTFNGAEDVNTSLGYLDYLVLAVEKELSLTTNKALHIRLPEGEIAYFNVTGTSSTSKIWDLSNPYDVKEIKVSGSANAFKFSNAVGQTDFMIFDGNDFPTPDYAGELANQNIKSLASKEGIIVSHEDFLFEAQRLAEFHGTFSGIDVGVVEVQEIYNEFSGGRQDLTAIRDFLKYCYDVGGNLKYATLFGDASYDYKNRATTNTNFVPVYESVESAHNIYSYSSDDYYGILGDDEGSWFEGVRSGNSSRYIVPFEDHTMEIGIGRLPVKSIEEAEDVVDKIIRYKTAPQAYGKWRTQLAYFSDDGDGEEHMKHAEAFSKIVDTIAIQYDSEKIYLDNFDQSDPSYALSAIQNSIENGVFMFNYMGHGNENQLTKETVIDQTAISGFTNRHKLPLFVTATCEFGKYDLPTVVSGAERLIINPNGGAIALLTTTRAVYAHTNFPLNQALHENLFARIDGKHPRLGDVIRMTKNASLNGPINRNFSLLGDPMLTLNYPEYGITFDQLSGDQDTLSALETYVVSGSVLNGGDVVTAFDGKGVITLWDIPQEKITKGQENDPFVYEDQTNALFRGEVTVENGVFTGEFILPKNISYKFDSGKLTMYAWNENESIDASGASRNFVLGGTAPVVTPDNSAPLVSIYINNEDFQPGGTVGTSSLLIAKVSDQSGINLSNNGFNQGISLKLNENESVDLSQFYTADQDTYQKGTILFPLQNLEPGNYTATLKVYDAHNNAVETAVEFKVSSEPILRLYNVSNYPNPVSSDGRTTFKFDHDREDEQLDVVLSLYNMQGQVMRQIDYEIDSSPRTVDYMTIDTTNDSGMPLEKGIYLYRLQVTSSLDGASNEVVKRLIIIN